MPEPKDMSKKEFEASLSLLHMMQRPSDASASSDDDATASAREQNPRPTKRAKKASGRKTQASSGLDGALLLAAAQQVDPSLEADDADGDAAEHGAWNLSRGFLRRNSQLTTLSHELNLDELREHFGKPIVEVAKEFGICTTFLKKICRRCGIKRWPHRQIRSLTRTIEMLRQAEANATSVQEKAKYASQIAHVEAKKRAVIDDPDANGKLERVKKSVLQRGGSPRSGKKTAASALAQAEELQTDLLHAVAVIAAAEATKAVEAQVSNVASQPSPPPKLSVEVIDVNAKSEARAIDELPATTPTAARVANSASGADSCTAPLGLKISPSHRKLLSLSKADGEGRVRTASLGSLQDLDASEPAEDLAAASTAPNALLAVAAAST